MTLLADGTGAPERTRIKFCGMTRAGDVRLAGELGVDAIGLIFAARSPRRVDVEHALSLRDAASAMVSVVALMMDNQPAEVDAIVQRLRPQLLQFHGSEDDASCARHGLPFLKAVAMRDVAADDVPALLARYPSAAGFVFDGHATGAIGGSGERFDWTRLPRQHLARPWLLAGGLNAANVGAAIRAVRPWGVDVSSGTELNDGRSAPGIKDGMKMRAFVEAVRSAEQELHDRESRKTHEQR